MSLGQTDGSRECVLAELTAAAAALYGSDGCAYKEWERQTNLLGGIRQPH